MSAAATEKKDEEEDDYDPFAEAPADKANRAPKPGVEETAAAAPEAKAPEAKAPLVKAPPVKVPPVKAPPVKAPPVEAPTVESPSATAPPAEAPPAQAPEAKAPEAKAASAPPAAAEDEAPWTKKAPWRRGRRKAAAQAVLELPAPQLQAVPFDPDNLAASVQAITAESQKIIDRAMRKVKDGKLMDAPWRRKQLPQAPPPPKRAGAGPVGKACKEAPWRKQQQQVPAPPPSKAGMAVRSKAASKAVGKAATWPKAVVRAGKVAMSKAVMGIRRAAMAKANIKVGKAALSKAAAIKMDKAATHKASSKALSKAEGLRAAKMGAMAKSKAAPSFRLRMTLRPPPPKTKASSKAEGIRAARMGAVAKSKAGPGFRVRPLLRPPPPKARVAFEPTRKVPMRVPWWAKQMADYRLKKAKAAVPKPKGAGKGDGPPSAAAVAKNFLKRPNNKRLNDAAAVAQEYFRHSEPAAESSPAAKKAKVEAVSFTVEVLEKAPDVLQTCRSLLDFLDKKREALLKPAIEVQIAADVKPRIEALADLGGRIAGLRRPGGWDARAKRIFDLGKLIGSDECQKAISAAEVRREKTKRALEQELEERGLNDRSVDDLTKERVAWADEQVRRDWIGWCARIARAKEAMLLAAAEKGSDSKAPAAAGGHGRQLTAVGVLEAILSGELAGS